MDSAGAGRWRKRGRRDVRALLRAWRRRRWALRLERLTWRDRIAFRLARWRTER